MPHGVGREADLAANLAIQEIEISSPTASEQALPLSWSS